MYLVPHPNLSKQGLPEAGRSTNLVCNYSLQQGHWTPLMKTLWRLQHGQYSTTDHIRSLTKVEIHNLIREYPILVVTYYYARILAAWDLIMKDPTIIGEIDDTWDVNEHRMKCVRHRHSLAWGKNAPVWGRDSDEVYCPFVDKFITCDSDTLTANQA